MNLSYSQMLQAIGLDCAPEAWQSAWPRALATFPSGGIPWLTDAYTQRVLAYYGLDVARFEQPYRQTLQAIREDSILQHLAWLWHTLCVLDEGADPEQVDAWPEIALLERVCPLFPAVILLSGHDTMLRRLEARGQTARFLQSYRQGLAYSCIQDIDYAGAAALSVSRMEWGLHFIQGDIYCLGSLQFIPEIYHGPVYGFTHRPTGRTVLLYKGEQAIDSQGLPTSGKHAAFMTRWEQSGDGITAHEVLPGGRMLPQAVHYPMGELIPLFAPGDAALSVHIPPQTDLSPSAVQQSFNACQAEFSTWPEDKRPRVLTCHSWMLSPQLECILPPDSRVLAFERRFIALPYAGHEKSFLRFVFRQPTDTAYADLREDTSLQRAAKAWLLEGKRLRAGGGLIPFNRL
nr:hypothetical protein [bacterium]